MHVIVIHDTHDPAGFQKAADEANELPSELKLPIHASTSDHSKAICIWEGPCGGSEKSVESVVGPYSKNEYFEMTVEGL